MVYETLWYIRTKFLNHTHVQNGVCCNCIHFVTRTVLMEMLQTM